MVKSDKTNSDSKSRVRDLVLSACMIIALWQLVVWLTQAPTYILPGPLRVFQAFIDYGSLIFEHAMVTISEVIIGLILGTTLGIATALGLMTSSFGRRFFAPILVLSQTIPVFALAPMLTLWLGYGLTSKIAMTILIIYFPVTSTFYDGLRNTPQGFLDLAQSMRATSFRTLTHVRVPAALPSLASGIRLAAVYAPIGAVIGEWVGASQGLGYLMLLANGRVKIDLMFAALIALCIFTILLRFVIGLVCNRISYKSGTGLGNNSG